MDQSLWTLVCLPPPPMFILCPTEPKFPVTKNVPQSGISHLQVRFSFFHIYKSAFCHLCHMFPTAPYGPYLLSPWPELISLVSTVRNLTGSLLWCLVVKNPPANVETQVQSLTGEDLTCLVATKPVCRKYWACALELGSRNYWAHTLQLLKPHTLEPVFHNGRKLSADPACCNYRKPTHSNEEPAQPKKINEI